MPDSKFRISQVTADTVPGALETGRLERARLSRRPVATAPGTVPIYGNFSSFIAFA